MGQTLTHGIYLPDEGERNCYNGLAGNWQLLDGAVGTVAEHTTQIAGKANAVHTHTKSDITDLLNSNFIPSANNSYDLGSSSYQWNNIYAKNYFYNGTAWGLDQINVWTNRNILEAYGYTIRENSVADTTAPSSDVGRSLIEVWNGNSTYWGGFGYRWYANGNSELVISLSNWNSNIQGYWEYKIGVNKAFNDLYFAPPHNLVNLGTPTNKWKTLNGINPGALSLPKIVAKATANIASAIVGTDGETQHLDGTDNYYTAALDGWISMCIGGFTQSNELWITVYDVNNETWGTSAESSTSARNTLFIIFPIRANQRMRFRMKCTSVTYARFYPCEGNV